MNSMKFLVSVKKEALASDNNLGKNFWVVVKNLRENEVTMLRKLRGSVCLTSLFTAINLFWSIIMARVFFSFFYVLHLSVCLRLTWSAIRVVPNTFFWIEVINHTEDELNCFTVFWKKGRHTFRADFSISKNGLRLRKISRNL